MATDISEKDLSIEIRKILQQADLQTLSRKMVRKQLEAHYGQDLLEQKAIINEQIAKIIEEIQEQGDDGSEEEDEEVGDEPPKKKQKKELKKKTPGRAGTAFNAEMLLSPELATFLAVEKLSRPEVVRRLWAYIKENGLQNPNDKRHIFLDDTLKGIFKRDEVTMFSMNKYLSKHLIKPSSLPEGGWDEIPRPGDSSEEDSAKEEIKRKKKEDKQRRKLAKAAKTAKGTKISRRNVQNTGLSKPLKLSEELSQLVGSSEMSRPEVVQHLWKYIKENELQNPDNKREIICDDTLTSLFNEKTVTMFSMNKFLSKHFV